MDAATERRLMLEEILKKEKPSSELKKQYEAGNLQNIIGNKYFPLKRTEKTHCEIYIQNIDLVRNDLESRLALLFLCFNKNKSVEIIKELQFDEDMEYRLILAQTLVEEIYFIVRPAAFKKFIIKYGEDVYDYIETIAKQQRKLYGQSDSRVLSRFYIREEIKKHNHPIYMEDLAITKKDLEHMGITKESDISFIMDKSLDFVHNYPHKNEKNYLLQKANKLYKSPYKSILKIANFIK